MKPFFKNILFLFFLLSRVAAWAQANPDYTSYIDQYAGLALAEEERTGIPAAIKMAQALLESGAGKGELASRSNNHFGIKCKSNWQGPVYYHDDDEKGECFRGYADVAASYKDHSDFLRNNARYQGLFALPKTDYQGWAYGLKAAGYATNPKYPQMLIRLIEEHQLMALPQLVAARKSRTDSAATAIATPMVADNAKAPALAAAPADTAMAESKETTSACTTSISWPTQEFEINETRVIYAPAQTSLLALAARYRLSLSQLLEFNDMESGTVLEKDQLIFLERKKKRAALPAHQVAECESLWSISQLYAVRLSLLQQYNPGMDAQHPTTGSLVQLQEPAGKKSLLDRLAGPK